MTARAAPATRRRAAATGASFRIRVIMPAAPRVDAGCGAGSSGLERAFPVVERGGRVESASRPLRSGEPPMRLDGCGGTIERTGAANTAKGGEVATSTGVRAEKGDIVEVSGRRVVDPGRKGEI